VLVQVHLVDRDEADFDRLLGTKLRRDHRSRSGRRALDTGGEPRVPRLVISTLVGLARLPQVLTLAISSCTLTALLTWMILPWVTRRARRWLYRDARPSPTNATDG
jgi:hypothetical protein